MGKYDYDIVCIGGGSGGLALTKEAATLGANVACLDFVKPSSHGTTWGIGGTCVNVGCIPKKLCHRAAILGEEAHHDAAAFGWEMPKGTHNWHKLMENVHDYVSGLNFKYRVALREKKVKYLNELGSIKDAHTLQLTNKKGVVKTITAGRIVIAVGGRPTQLDCPGGEHAIDSDDVFQQSWEGKTPGKTLVVGASYVALECAGFLQGVGYDTTIMVRSILLRGFDQEYANYIGDFMEKVGMKFLRSATPTKIVKMDDGKFQVFWNQNGVEGSDIYDTVIAAIGRKPDTSKLGLENVGVKTAPSGKIICANGNEQTSVPNIYAIGDCVHDMLELTPVAVQSAVLLAKRLYGNSKQTMAYDLIATTVFTPIEYGACGLSEEDAIARFGAEDVEVYHKEVSPLEWQLVKSKPEGIARCKLICLKSDNLRIVGMHILAPNSGEIMQGFAAAMRKGSTYHDFQDTVGIHPTVAEDFTTLTITKSSGADAAASGC
jgi:thioredoxin reductase (NADPH)